MTIWRAVLVSVITAMVGFVGGVWFVSSGLGFRMIQLPPVPNASAGAAPRLQSQPRARTNIRPKVEAVGVPEALNISGTSGGLGRPAERGDLLPSPGCGWEIEPYEFRIDQEWNKSNRERLLVGVPSLDPKTGRLRYSLIQSTQSGQSPTSLRLVLFDAVGNRYAARVSPTGRSSGSGGSVDYSHHDWDDLPKLDPPGTAYFGVERVVPDSARLTAEAARDEAKRKAVDILPPPRLGEPFDFDLATVDGKRIRSQDLKGKAVLVVLTGPSPRGPIALERIRKEFSTDVLSVVGVSFDAEAEEVVRDFAPVGREGVSLVHIPNDPAIRRLWREGSEMPHLPAYWIVDPVGVLRFQTQWFDLEDRLAIALGRPTQRGRFDAFVRGNKALHEAQQKAKNPPTGPPSPAQPAPVASPKS